MMHESVACLFGEAGGHPLETGSSMLIIIRFKATMSSVVFLLAVPLFLGSRSFYS